MTHLDPKRFYNLKKPCADCPFRTDKSYLRPERAQQIADALTGAGHQSSSAFYCHKTLGAAEEDVEGDVELGTTPKTSFCAGAMIMIEKTGARNAQMQIGERLGFFDPAGLRLDSPVHDSFEEWVDAQREM